MFQLTLKFGLHRVLRTDQRHKSKTRCIFESGCRLQRWLFLHDRATVFCNPFFNVHSPSRFNLSECVNCHDLLQHFYLLICEPILSRILSALQQTSNSFYGRKSSKTIGVRKIILSRKEIAFCRSVKMDKSINKRTDTFAKPEKELPRPEKVKFVMKM